MTRPDPAKSTQTRGSTEGVPCAKCQHVNPPGSNTCEECKAHLWVVCHHCGHRNRRFDAHCIECASRLHRSALKQVSKKLFGSRRNIAAWQIATLIIAVWLVYKLIVFFVEYQPPPE